MLMSGDIHFTCIPWFFCYAHIQFGISFLMMFAEFAFGKSNEMKSNDNKMYIKKSRVKHIRKYSHTHIECMLSLLASMR